MGADARPYEHDGREKEAADNGDCGRATDDRLAPLNGRRSAAGRAGRCVQISGSHIEECEQVGGTVAEGGGRAERGKLGGAGAGSGG